MISFELSIASCKFTPHGERNGAQNAIYARQIFNDNLLPQGLLFHCECHRLPIIYPLSTSSLHTPSISRQDYSPLQLALFLITIDVKSSPKIRNLGLDLYGDYWELECVSHRNSRSRIPKNCAHRVRKNPKSTRKFLTCPESISGIWDRDP